MTKEYKISDKAYITKDVRIEFSPDPSEFSKYQVTRKTEFGNMVKKLMDILNFGSSDKVIRIVTMKHDLLEVDATLYGFTLLRAAFSSQYYDIVKL